jgi:hypothetical protein
MAGTQVIGQNTLDAVRSVMTCSPDYLIMGMSAVTFYGGVKGANEFQAQVEKEAGIKISIGSHSCTAALRAYGGVKRIAVLSPYYPVANEQVIRYFTDSRRLPAVQKLDGDRGSAARGPARKADRTERQRPRCRRHRPGWDELEHGTVGRCSGDVAWETCHRHQHGDLLACAPPEQDFGQDSGTRPIARSILTHGDIAARRVSGACSGRSIRLFPNVWSGRAQQEEFDELAVSGPASMHPAFDWNAVLRAITDISAPAISLADRPQLGLCIPKIRFCNIGDEGRRERVVM